MKRKQLIFLLLPLLMASCEEMVTDIDVPQSESHYVLHAYISPEDTAVTVTVGKSQPVFGNHETDTSWVSQAHVFINDFELTREYDTYYRFSAPAAAFTVVPGESYTISLRIGSETVCSGSCTVPATRNESMMNEGIDSVENQSYDGYTYYDYYIMYSFTDIAGEENFYRVAAEATYVDPYSGDTTTYTSYPESFQFIKDVKFTGGEYSDRLLLGGTDVLNGISGLRLILYTSDADYYYYHRAILSQTGDDPFSEPVTIPSDVENGLGCVAGVRKYVITVF